MLYERRGYMNAGGDQCENQIHAGEHLFQGKVLPGTPLQNLFDTFYTPRAKRKGMHAALSTPQKPLSSNSEEPDSPAPRCLDFLLDHFCFAMCRRRPWAAKPLSTVGGEDAAPRVPRFRFRFTAKSTKRARSRTAVFQIQITQLTRSTVLF